MNYSGNFRQRTHQHIAYDIAPASRPSDRSFGWSDNSIKIALDKKNDSTLSATDTDACSMLATQTLSASSCCRKTCHFPLSDSIQLSFMPNVCVLTTNTVCVCCYSAMINLLTKKKTRNLFVHRLVFACCECHISHI